MYYSLMNPVHLRKEIADLENEVIPENQKKAQELNESIREAYAILDNQAGNETITLTATEVKKIVETLATAQINTWRFYRTHEFAVRVYKNLLKDRRWIIGSKLRFLQK